MALTTLKSQSRSLSQSPYEIDVDQTLRASQALLRHLQVEAKRLRETSAKKNLLEPSASDPEAEEEGNDDPIWLTLTTKQHIVDKNRLRPSKIPVPNPLNKSEDLNICLIVADPQRAVKNIISDPTFPSSLSSRVNRVIGFSKVKARYKTFESRRQLLGEHDIFLADDRIITRLPEALGKVFYQGTAKRPIPIRIAHQDRQDGKLIKNSAKKQPKAEKSAFFASVDVVAKEIQNTLNTVPVSLKPGTNVAVRVGSARFKPGQLSENITVVANAIIEKHVVKGWRNVKAIHIKSPTSAAMPIWLADDLWVEEGAVARNGLLGTGTSETETVEGSNKRKRDGVRVRGPQTGMRKKLKTEAGSPATKNDSSHDASESGQGLTATRKAKLEEEKQKAFSM